MLVGLLNTVLLAVIAQTVAIVIGIVIALMRRSANPVAKWFATGYIWLFRGLPVLLQILIWYNLALVIPTIAIPLPFGGDICSTSPPTSSSARSPPRCSAWPSTRAPIWPRSCGPG